MSQRQNARIAEQLLSRIAAGAVPDEIATMFSSDADFDIAGDVDAFPWIGHKRGSAAVSDFIRELRRRTEPVRFEVGDILANEERAVIVGRLVTRVRATNRMIDSTYAIVLTIAYGIIARFQMLEDSFAVSQAARP